MFASSEDNMILQNDWTVNAADYSKFTPAEAEDELLTEFKNYEDTVNANYDVKPVSPIGMYTKRTGVLGYKIGMTQIWDKWGVMHPCSVVHLDRVQVTQVFTFEKNGFNSIQLGLGEQRLKSLKKSMAGQFLKHGLPPKEHIASFPITPENFLPLGYMLGPRHFTIGQLVDVSATSIGKGTQGVMKRWNMSGGNATHGNSKAHRSVGSIGQCEYPGKVWKGRKMAGQMGNKSATVQNQPILKIDHDRSLLYIKGQVPGPISGVIKIRDAVKKGERQFRSLPYPTWIKGRDREIESQWVWEGPKNDPFEEFIHENDAVSGKDGNED